MVTSKALSLFDNFNQLTPYAVGYDRVFDQLQKYVQNNVQSSGFPPYNIRKEDDYKYVIELALAGFSESDIEVEVKDSTLTVRSKEDKGTDESQYVHRGIAKRSFSRSWSLSDDMVVKGAEFNNGLLNISLEKVVPEEKKPRLIPITKLISK